MPYVKKTCGKRHAFCGVCQPDSSVGKSGGPHTPEHRANISASMKKQHQILSDNAKTRWARGDFTGRTGPTNLEIALSLLLQDAGLAFESQKSFGRFQVDFWVPSRGLIFEADGQYWHNGACDKRQSYNTRRTTQEERDACLITQANVLGVVHLTDDDLAPWTPSKGGN